MTSLNVSAKIEIDEVKIYAQSFPAEIANEFLEGELITGTQSGATAIVFQDSGLGNQDMKITGKRGEFYYREAITSVSGLGVIAGSIFNDEALYTNSSINITSGLWVLETSKDLLVDIEAAVKRMNIYNGGNYATGYSFGFTITNIDSIKQITEHGIFLKGLEGRFYIDFGSGYQQVWTGQVDTFPKEGTISAKFTCIEALRVNNNNIGSSKIPICLNRNFNCKPVLYDEESEIVEVRDGITLAALSFVDDTYHWIQLYIADSTNLLGNEYNGAILTVICGAGAGTSYMIKSNTDKARFYLDGDVSILKSKTDASDRKNASVIQISYLKKYYNLSTYPVRKIHSSRISNTEKPLTLFDGESSFPLTYNENYFGFTNSEGNQSIRLQGLDKKGSYNFYARNELTSIDSGFSITSAKESNTKKTYYLSKQLDSSIVSKIKYSIENSTDAYIHIEDFTLTDAYIISTVTYGIADIKFNLFGYVKDEILPNGYSATIASGQVDDFYIIPTGTNDLYVYATNKMLEYSDEQILDNVFSFEAFSSVSISIEVTVEIFTDSPTSPKLNDIVGLSDGIISVSEYNQASTEDLTVGCIGENVKSQDQFYGYAITMKYLDLTYGGVDPLNIDSLSYSQAELDFSNFPSTTIRNPAPQILEQIEYNSLIKDFLYFSHLGLFIDRFGKRKMSNWLPKSTVFNDTIPESTYNTNNILSISSIKRPTVIKLCSDFELKYDYNESTEKFQRTMRIKATDLAAFDFDLCTEGVSRTFYQEALEAWELFASGYKRIKRFSETIVESKIIKYNYSVEKDGGESEAINFIRNQAGHVNRELEEVTISVALNYDDAIKDLLSYDSINHPKITSGKDRYGWLTEHRIDWKQKRIHLTYILDISLDDPFLVQIGIIQDDATETEEIVNDETSTEEIVNGAGK